MISPVWSRDREGSHVLLGHHVMHVNIEHSLHICT